jgi:hypothetical protein
LTNSVDRPLARNLARTAKDMTPLNEDENRGIVEAYKALVNAIRKDAASATTTAAFEAFQWTYRGNSRAYVDMFPEPDQRTKWVGQLDIYLHDQIEPHFW